MVCGSSTDTMQVDGDTGEDPAAEEPTEEEHSAICDGWRADQNANCGRVFCPWCMLRVDHLRSDYLASCYDNAERLIDKTADPHTVQIQLWTLNCMFQIMERDCGLARQADYTRPLYRQGPLSNIMLAPQPLPPPPPPPPPADGDQAAAAAAATLSASLDLASDRCKRVADLMHSMDGCDIPDGDETKAVNVWHSSARCEKHATCDTIGRWRALKTAKV